MSICEGIGRYGNQIFRSLAVSIFAEKFNLVVKYKDKGKIERLGLKLFNGVNIYKNSIELNDNNYLDLLNKDSINNNIRAKSYFQTKRITDIVFSYLNSDKIMKDMMYNNKYKSRYNNNNDCFIHIRLGDVSKYNPGFEYYDQILSKLKFDNLYIASDSPEHDIIVKLKNKYNNFKFYNGSLEDIILFGSTNKYVILSYGTFSGIIGYLSYYSNVYSLKYCEEYCWDWNKKDECDIFSDKSNKIGKWIVN